MIGMSNTENNSQSVKQTTYIERNMFIRYGRDSRHEVFGDEGSNDNGSLTGLISSRRYDISIKVNGDDDDRHLSDCPMISVLFQDLMSEMICFPQCRQDLWSQVSLRHIMNREGNWISKHVTDSVNVVTNFGNQLCQP